MPSGGLKQPIGQKRLTNIAVVRLRKAGCVFEIACYKNKVSNWRAEIETDLDEVLQTTAVFSNVSKGITAKEKDMETAFSTTDAERICIEILSKGELQVSEKERKLEYDNMYKDVASIIAEKCVDPNTQRQYTATIIERALKDVHFNPDLKKSAKQQAFSEALPLLQERFNIQRAQMKVQLHVPLTHSSAVKQLIQTKELTLESTNTNHDTSTMLFDCLVEPGYYRTLHRSLEELTQGKGRIELMNLAAISETASMTPTQVDSIERDESVESMEAPRRQVIHVRREKSVEKRHVVYPRGSIVGLPADFARREMFLEIDALDPGWEVELIQNEGSTVIKAEFYSPNGEAVGPFAKARRQALASNKKSATCIDAT